MRIKNMGLSANQASAVREKSDCKWNWEAGDGTSVYPDLVIGIQIYENIKTHVTIHPPKTANFTIKSLLNLKIAQDNEWKNQTN
jgi:hypothetical protein